VTLATARLLVGRKIVAVDLQPFDDCDSSGRKIKTSYEPRFILDNGARLTFSVDEIDCGDGYGVRPNYHPRQVRGNRAQTRTKAEK
jgi:hypothetical protein